MTLFGFNFALALVWCAVLGRIGPVALAVGFALGTAALWLTRPLHGDTGYFPRLARWLRFAGWLLGRYAAAVAESVQAALGPAAALRPGVVRIPLAARSRNETLLVALAVSMTPGTLTLDIAREGAHPVLYLHGLFVGDPEAVRAEIGSRLEPRVLELLR
jgi:multicomponent Na+:H+ antiporter subunit E